MKITKQRLKEIIREELNEISFFGQDIGGGTFFKISKQDLVDAGLPKVAVQNGLYDQIQTKLEPVVRERGFQALQSAVKSLSLHDRTPGAVLKALKKEL